VWVLQPPSTRTATTAGASPRRMASSEHPRVGSASSAAAHSQNSP
jgi:hypothetical protein